MTDFYCKKGSAVLIAPDLLSLSGASEGCVSQHAYEAIAISTKMTEALLVLEYMSSIVYSFLVLLRQ